MSSDRQHAPDESDLTSACREMIAQLAREARRRRPQAPADARLAQRAERETHES